MNAAKLLVATVCAVTVHVPVLQAATHEVRVIDFRVYVPDDITIQAGDTVRFINGPGGNPHDVTADDGTWASPTGVEWTYERTFNSVGDFGYYCNYHDPNDDDGTHHGIVRVTAPTSDLNPGHSGNWWAGASRNGEGVQVEVSSNGTGGRVLVATMYSYDPMGQPIFLLAVGPVVSGQAAVDVYIYEGPSWGAGFNPAELVESPWGSGLFTSSGCNSISMSLTPNANYVAQGYSPLGYELSRLTTSAIPCPIP